MTDGYFNGYETFLVDIDADTNNLTFFFLFFRGLCWRNGVGWDFDDPGSDQSNVVLCLRFMLACCA